MHSTMKRIEVDVIIPVHNAAQTIVETVESAMHQVIPEARTEHDSATAAALSIHVCCYDDGSTDDSWRLLTELTQRNWQEVETADQKSTRIPTTLWISQSSDGVGRGAGYARNRAVDMRGSKSATKTLHQFLCMLDSDDVMHPARVVEQVAVLLALPESERERTLLGCTFHRNPPDSTWHYAQWANGLTDERLSLERFREVTLLQPTWMLLRSRFQSLGGYIEAPPPDSTVSSMDAYLLALTIQNGTTNRLQLVHPTFETLTSLRVAEDLRFFHEHLQHGNHSGLLRLHRTTAPLVTYRHRAGQSQSSQTPRKLLLYLRALAFETSVLLRKDDPQWQKHNGAFVVWGAGRDGKDFVKALSAEMRKRVYCMVDVDEKKIQGGYYMNRQIDVKIPIVHFALLAADPAVRQTLQHSFEQGRSAADNNEPGYGHITKGKQPIAQDRPGDEKKAVQSPSPRKKRRLYTVAPGVLDLAILPKLPVVVCVAMYRTDGALEHNVKMIDRTEGKDLWHFS